MHFRSKLRQSLRMSGLKRTQDAVEFQILFGLFVVLAAGVVTALAI